MIVILERGNGKGVVDPYLGNNYVRRDPFCPYIVKASEKEKRKVLPKTFW